MIDDLWDFGDPAESERRFRTHLEAAVGSEREETFTQLARSLGLQRKFEEAATVLDGLETSTPRTEVRRVLERGRVFNSSGHPDLARPLFLDAWKKACDASEDVLAIDAAHMVAIVEPFDESIVWNERALAMAEASDDQRARNWKGSLYNNLGWSYHDKGDYEKALELFSKGVDERRQQGDADRLRIARWTVARTLRSLGRMEEALQIQQELLAAGQETGRTDMYVIEEVGECLFALGRIDEARPYLLQAFELLSHQPHHKENEPDRLESLKIRGSAE